MSQHRSLKCECTKSGWTRGEYQEIQPYGQGTLFEPQRTLSKDAMGEVQIVRFVAPPCDSLVRRTITLHPWQPEENKGVADEIKRLKSLDHRHIVAVIGSYEVENGYSFLMYLVGNQDLEAFLTQMDSGEGKQCHQQRTSLHGWLSCLASALFYIHDNGLQHGKIAPKNIIHRGAEIYFTDFGLKMPWERDKAASTTSCVRTTTAYTAPEAKHVELRDAQNSDIFSLGCVYLEMLTVLDSRSVQDFRMHCDESVKRNGIVFFWRKTE